MPVANVKLPVAINDSDYAFDLLFFQGTTSTPLEFSEDDEAALTFLSDLPSAAPVKIEIATTDDDNKLTISGNTISLRLPASYLADKPDANWSLELRRLSADGAKDMLAVGRWFTLKGLSQRSRGVSGGLSIGSQPSTAQIVLKADSAAVVYPASGPQGAAGDAGEDGTNGWSPVLSLTPHDAGVVIQVTDWQGGTGDKPDTGYVGDDGIVSDIEQAATIVPNGITTAMFAAYVIDTDSGLAANSPTRLSSQSAIKAYVDAMVASIVLSAPTTLDTLSELATALGNDPNFATTMATALGSRLRVDAAQGLTLGQQALARANVSLDAGNAVGFASLALGGASTGATLDVAGSATVSGATSLGNVNVTNTAVPTNGMYYTGAALGLSTGGTLKISVSGGGSLVAVASGSFQLSGSSASATTPTLIPSRADATTGYSSAGAGKLNFVASGATVIDYASSQAGTLTAPNLNVTGAVVPTNGMYLGSANTLYFSSNSTLSAKVSSGNVRSGNTLSWQLLNNNASGTTPTLIPTQADVTSGIGASGAGHVNVIAAGATVGDFTAAGLAVPNITLTALPTSDPHIAGRLWNNSGVLNVSAG